MMTQYLEIKKQNADCLLFYRMGDFYELFFNDAIKASKILNITLTKRGTNNGQDIPMCGVPYHSADTYIANLVKSGNKIAICEQMEAPIDAKTRGEKVIRREVVRIVTSGTLIEDGLLKSHENNFLMAAFIDENDFKKHILKKNDFKSIVIHFATIDITTEQFFVNSLDFEAFSLEYLRFNPKEIIIPDFLSNTFFSSYIKSENNAYVTILPKNKFNCTREKERLLEYFMVKTLDGFGFTNENQHSVCGVIIDYINLTQKCSSFKIKQPKIVNNSKFLIMDTNTINNLEIVKAANNNQCSLLNTINFTLTAPGYRLLNKRILTPITDILELNNRLDIIDFYIANKNLQEIRKILQKIPDVERSLARINFMKSFPKDVGVIRDFLLQILQLHEIFPYLKIEKNEGIEESEGNNKNKENENKQTVIDKTENNNFWNSKFSQFKSLHELLSNALNDVLSNNICDVIREKYSEKLDELRQIKNNHEEIILNLQEKYINNTSIKKLKIKFNNILGFYVEIPLSQQNLITYDFQHKQTLINCIRYTTEELLLLQKKLSFVQSDIEILENNLYSEILLQIKNFGQLIQDAANNIAKLDLSTAFAHLAISKNYTRPQFFENANLKIISGRHPTVENLTEFTSNDCILDKSNIMLLTGPNMSGKSTYLRQNALIIFLAQIGCFVPAECAKIGIVDKLFSRIGAYDEIAKGRSTFMVEMIETATIINNATPSSFVILDEVGRGTSTFDGLSIAWAVLENLYFKNKARTLFATHFHELIKIQNEIPNIILKTLKIQEWENNVIFYHNVIDGYTDKSYGIHVAKLAGVPGDVIQRAQNLLNDFEDAKEGGGKCGKKEYEEKSVHGKNDVKSVRKCIVDGKNLDARGENAKNIKYENLIFDINEPQNMKKIDKKQYDNLMELSKIYSYVNALNLDDISPRRAHEILYSLKNKKI